MWYGLLDLPLWGYVLVTLALTHITIVSVTIFLHRHQAHRGLDLHPAVAHFFRFWLWLTTGMVTAQWVAVHRKHHAKCESAEDPHSPVQVGINTVLWRGAELYRQEAAKPETLKKYARGTPDDWLERHLYARHTMLGIVLMAMVDVILFGVVGITVWAVQMLWIPFWAAGVINGLGHFWGYRNYEPADASTNISPVGILIGGEELHNNHHAFPSSAKFASKAWEFDLGWLYIRCLESLGLATVKRLAPKPLIVPEKRYVDQDTVTAVIVNRFHVMASYAREVLLPTLAEEKQRADNSYRRLLARARRALIKETSLMDEGSQRRLQRALTLSERLAVVYQYKVSLQTVWNRSTMNRDTLLRTLQEWCAQAESTGIQALEDFARRLRGYSLQATV